MVEKNFEIRPYKEGEGEAINNLFEKVFHKKRSFKEWKWKFLDNPAVDDPSDWISIAEREGSIIGHYASISLEMKVGDRIIKTPQPVDSMIDPDSKAGIKLFRQLNKHNVEITSKHTYFGFGFPNETAYKVGKKMLGYMDTGRMIPLFRRLGVRTIIKRRLTWLPALIIDILHKLMCFIYAFLLKTGKTDKSVDVSLYDSFSEIENRESLESLCNAMKDRYEIINIRTIPYLIWRYTGREIKIITIESENEMTGFAVVTVEEEEESRTGYILDIVYKDKVTVLINETVRYFLDRKADFILCALIDGDPMAEDLKKSGFSEHTSFKPFPLVYFHFHSKEGDDFLKNPSNWHLTYSDSDRF